MNQPDLYPLRFHPIYKEKVWGGRSFEKLGRTIPGDESVGIGESWEVADLTTTSKSGGGGNAEHSVVAEGPLAGKTLRALMEQYGSALLGEGVAPAEDGGFPLLIKFLDAKENLSVQVHPSPDYAAAHPDAHLKSEAWYIIDAEPGTVIYTGITPSTTPQTLRDAIETNTDEAVAPLLNAVPAKKGDCHYLPSGTLHALGAGVLVAEVQTPSDTTFRVYDWGRTDRELHVEQAMACIDFSSAAQRHESLHSITQGGFMITTKAACDFFHVDEYQAEAKGAIQVTSATAQLWIPIQSSERAIIETLNGHAWHYLFTGQTILMPATIGTAHLSTSDPGCWLRVTLP